IGAVPVQAGRTRRAVKRFIIDARMGTGRDRGDVVSGETLPVHDDPALGATEPSMVSPHAETVPAGSTPGAPLDGAMALLRPGLVLGGRYEVREHLGSGGMGAVYLAQDRLVEHEVAIKFIRPSLAQDKGERTRLRHEVRLAQSVTHENVARTYTLEE